MHCTEEQRLRITEIFHSIQGEADSVGWPTVFVRLTGCPLRCQYCDTAYAFHGGECDDLEEIVHQVAKYTPRYVTVTGGEPLAQKNCTNLLARLCEVGYQVSIETSGALPISDVDSPGSPGHGPEDTWFRRVRPESVMRTSHDCDPGSGKVCYLQSCRLRMVAQMVQEYKLAICCQVLFSPVMSNCHAVELADWITARLSVGAFAGAVT